MNDLKENPLHLRPEPRWMVKPTTAEHIASLLRPNASSNWENIKEIVKYSGFGVSEEQILDEQNQLTGAVDYGITWPTEAEQKADYVIFSDVIRKIIFSCDRNDKSYSLEELPIIFNDLGKSTLFSLLFSKYSQSQGAGVKDHIENVANLTFTDGLTPYERIILRITAIFHDSGKAFENGSDQLQYHALISADIIKRILREFEPMIQEAVSFMAQTSSQEAYVNKTEYADFDEAITNDYDLFVNQVTEITRLHHVLEKIDKGDIDLMTIAAIFIDNNVDTLLFGLFALADGGSVVPDNELYGKYLVNNMNILTKLVEQVELARRHQAEFFQVDVLDDIRDPESVNNSVVQAFIVLLDKLVEKLGDIIEKIRSFINNSTQEISDAFASGVLALNSTDTAIIVYQA